MKKWPRFKDIFAFYPSDDGSDVSAESVYNTPATHWKKIKFDNAIRLWIAVPTYLACHALSAYGTIPSVVPMTLVFLVYGAIQLLITWIFMDAPFVRRLDFVFATLDMVAMSLSIYFTGGIDSPLYFIYFIPLVVHAFHRDWGLVVFSGFGGVTLYGAAIGKSFTAFTPALITNLGARIFFMLLTVSIACVALSVLKKQDSRDLKRIRRLKNLTLVSEHLNRVTTIGDRNDTALLLIQLINDGLGTAINAWTRFLFVEKDGKLLKALADPKNEKSELSQEISTLSCPVMKNNNPFELADASKGAECPTEQFSFGSHICMPISGAENEIFGVLFVGSPRPNAFQSEEKQYLEFIAKSFGLSIQRLFRMEELRKSLEMNSWVMAATIASSRSSEATVMAILDGVREILDANSTELTLENPSAVEIKKVYSKGGPLPEDRTLVLPLLSMKGESMGVIKAAKKEATEKFSAIETETAFTFATRAAIAIENAIAHEKQRERIHHFMEGPHYNKAA